MAEDGNKTIIRSVPASRADAVSAKREAYLIVISGGTVGAMHKLPERGELVIGRAPDAGIRIGDEDVSRHHARISVAADGEVLLTDLDSTNGTYVNAVKITEHRLQDGDKVQIGPQVVLKFQYQDAVEEEFQRKLFESAVKDGLTGVYNKKYFLDRIDADFAYAKRHRTPLALLLFDIDHFKRINDTFGHAAGDYVLKQLALVIKQTLRSEDLFARFGGEEFAILVRGFDDEKARILAERLRGLVEHAAFAFDGKRIAVTISIGIGTVGADDASPQDTTELVLRADQYLYEAKRKGRNRVAGK